ncbi:MAG TPA: winged helix-turn-helix domain-containing protein [Steroidobacteraceae bacterium]|nr:winged helix-turn-helix domain-containing protein [Steroidobacteraceae bacterium]
MATDPQVALEFGQFTLVPTEKRLLCDGTVVPLAPKVFDTLVLLVKNQGRLIEKEELLKALWPHSVVEEVALSHNVSQLRKALGDPADDPKVIETVPKRGYRFIAAVRQMIAPATPSAQPSLAVLPFHNRGGNTSLDYFVDGMMDEIVSALTRIRSLFVIASSATMSMAGPGLDPLSAARRLGVRYVLEGSVWRSDSQVRIAAKLTDADRGIQIWADRFDYVLEDIFALQDRVALSVAGVIEPNIRSAELSRVARSPLENLGCYDLYLRAAHLRATLRKTEVTQALELLNRALSMDPEFGPALAQAAGCHSQIYCNYWAEDRDAHRRAGLELAERAVHAGGEDAAVLAQVANAITDLSPDIDRAMGLIERATALNPGSAYAWFISGIVQIMRGNGEDAVAHLQRAARLDPVSPLHDIACAHIGVGMFLQGNFEEALRILRRSNYRPPRIQLTQIIAHARLGQWQEAREQLDLLEKDTGSTAENIISATTPDIRAMIVEAIAQIRKWRS